MSKKNSKSKGPEAGTDFDCSRKEKRPVWLEQKSAKLFVESQMVITFASAGLQSSLPLLGSTTAAWKLPKAIYKQMDKVVSQDNSFMDTEIWIPFHHYVLQNVVNH